MNVFKKIGSRAAETGGGGGVSDRKSEVSNSSNSTSKAKLSRFRLKMRMMSGLGMAGMVSGTKTNTVTYENTYKTDPDDNRKFSQRKAEQIIYSVLDGYLSKREYDPRRFPLLSKTLAELIKDRVKDTGLERYKIVALVTICQNKDQSMLQVSRCLWNQAHDNHASVVFEGANFYAIGSVYAVYFD
ncbi:dynein light chain Tctex-type 5-like [Babylonia areolata]|uniref:dynein light chain Tctex-type 5-like n=1 Tax=Babylonia areolata TaxID=304850 RepID=UPI003FD2FE92